MFLIQEILVDESIATTKFACDLNRCKGACCTMPGGRGAPLLEEEIKEIVNVFPAVRKYLSERHLKAIERQGLFEGRSGSYVTPCVGDHACVFVTYENDIAKCAFEKAFLNGETTWRKPISCHLFPIRMDGDNIERLRFEFIPECKPALARGVSEKIYLSDFLKDALIRVYGQSWYKEFRHQCKREERTSKIESCVHL